MSLKVYILPTLKMIFVQAVLNTVVYQMLIVYTNVLVNSAVLFKQQKMFSVFAQPDINTRGIGRIRDSYANPRRSRGFA